MTTITVYSRKGCGLCREAEAAVAELAEGRADVTVVDIDRDPELYDRYTVRVPVVAINGEELFDFVVDRTQLAEALDFAERRSSGR